MALKKHILIRFVAVLLALVVVVVVTVVVVGNLTLAQLGLSDKELAPNKTVENLGISDVKVGQVISLLKSLSAEQDISKIAPNAYTSAHKASADTKFKSTSIGLLADTPNYQKLLFSSAAMVRPLTLQFPEVAYALSAALQQFYTSAEGEIASDYIQAVEVLKRLNAHFAELSLFSKDGKLYMKAVIDLDVSEYIADINSQISVYQISNKVYCTLVNEVEVKNSSILGLVQIKGVLAQKHFVSVAVNDLETQLSEKALNALFKLSAEDDETLLTVTTVDIGVCALISDFLSHIGGIGVMNGATEVQYGAEGIDFTKGEITFLPKVL